MAVCGMRGLSVFIADVRNSENREAERLRVDKELANIRTKFRSDKSLTPYEKKKYVWKMLYIYMLGYDVDFGHMEAVNLISGTKYAEKQVGYIVTSCLLNENDDFLRLVINTVRNDIIGRSETFQCLALTMVGNVGGKEFAEALAPDVQKLLVSPSIRPLVRKKAALCLLRLHRKSTDALDTDGWSEKMCALLEERELGVLTAVMSLLVSLVSTTPLGYTDCIPHCVRILERLTRSQDIPQEYTYYGIPSPWLQVKTMRALQYFSSIPDPSTRQALLDVLQRVLVGTDVVKNVNKNNAAHAVLFEAVALLMHLEADAEMLQHCCLILGKFIAVREPNIRYLGLETMARMLLLSDVHESVRKHQGQITASLKDPDISIRRRALDLLYGMCDTANAVEVVEELLQYMSSADFGMREELALKAAILAERFAPDLAWYVETIFQLIEKAGDFVGDDIWHRVVQFVTNNEDLQAYAAGRAVVYLSKPAVHESMVKLGGYLVGEYSHLLTHQPGCTPMEMLKLLNDKFGGVSTPTKAQLLSSCIKLLLHAQPPQAELQEAVEGVLLRHVSFLDTDVQQRAVEYLQLAKMGGGAAQVLAEMPKFPERQSALMKLQAQAEGEGEGGEVSATAVRVQLASSTDMVLAQPPAPPHGAVPGPLLKPNGELSEAEPPPPPSPPPQEAEGGEGEEESVGVEAEAVPEAAAPPPPPQPQPPRTLDPGEMLGELLAIEAPPPPQPPPPPPLETPQTAADAPQEGGEALALTPFHSMPANGVAPVGDLEEWFSELVLADSGVLYEDPYLQIGLRAEYRGPHGRLMLYVGNKDTGPITDLRLSVASTPGLRVQLPPVPPLIPPRAQLQLPVDVTAVLPPAHPPLLTLGYSGPGDVRVEAQLRLPVALNKFLEAAPIAAPDFFGRWKALTGPPHKVQQVLRGVKPLALSAVAQLLASLHIGTAPNLDPNPNNLVAATTLFIESATPLSVLVRMETDPADRTQIRITVGCLEAPVASSVLELIKDHLTAKDQSQPAALLLSGAP